MREPGPRDQECGRDGAPITKGEVSAGKKLKGLSEREFLPRGEGITRDLERKKIKLWNVTSEKNGRSAKEGGEGRARISTCAENLSISLPGTGGMKKDGLEKARWDFPWIQVRREVPCRRFG